MKETPLEENDTDFIDIDTLLVMMIEEFKSKRKHNQNLLMKNFMRNYQAHEGLINTEELDQILKESVPSESPSALVSYPTELTFRRVFIYALTAGQNSYDINGQELLAGASRFGIDSPLPIVAKRLALYGNEMSMNEAMREAFESRGFVP